MTESGFSNTPQFGTAEYHGPATDACKLCQQPISGAYYRANAAMLCPACADRVRGQIPQDNHAAFVRGILFGIGGFVLGLILYAGFTILTGIEIGFVSLAVGWLVGKAIMLGSGGIGGRRYQIAAVLLTYAAVSMAFIPIVIHYQMTHKVGRARPAQQQTSPPAPPSAASPNTQPSQSQQETPSQTPPADNRPQRGLGAELGMLALFGLASPFLMLKTGLSGIIGLIILFVGMQFAWKITGGVRIAIDGPFQTSSAAKA